MQFLCINLDRRPDRKQFIEQNKQNIPIEFRSAVDGKTLVLTPEIKHLFRNNDFNWRRSVIGCALSHINLWKELANSNSTHFIIFEDDTEFIPDFMNKFTIHIDEIVNSKKQLVFLGYLEYHRRGLEQFNFSPSTLKLHNIKMSGGGLGGYMLSKEGAISLLDWINKMGVSRAIDYEILTWAEHKNITPLYYSPKLVRNQEVDTDIQRDFIQISGL